MILRLQLLCVHLRSSMGDLAEPGLFPKRLLACSCRSKDGRASPAEPGLPRTSSAFRPPGHADMQAGSRQSCRSSFSTISTAAALTQPGCSQQLPSTRVRTQPGQRGAGCRWDRALGWANAFEPTPEQTCRSPDQGNTLKTPAVSSRTAGALSRELTWSWFSL